MTSSDIKYKKDGIEYNSKIKMCQTYFNCQQLNDKTIFFIDSHLI